MDLIYENVSGASKVVAARHINVEKSFPNMNNEVNSTLLCYSYNLQPDFGSYFTALGYYAWGLWTYGAVVLAVVCLFYVISIQSALRHWRECFTNVATILAVYPIVAAAGFLVIVLPRFRLIAEAIAQEAVMIAMYHLFCLMVSECGGADQVIRRAPDTRLETRVLPCCCWPCCVIPRPKLQKRNLMWVRYIVLQMPIVQALIYVVLLALWAEDMMLYHRYFAYLQPFVAASILTGVWGMIMCVRLLESAGYKPKARFLVLQLALIIVKVQCGFAKVLPEFINIRCITSLHPSVFVNSKYCFCPI
ncbi:hypothetical protein O3G_MSEX006452 [Manduca sexta]|uniref:Organic solute transporter alpha-like protein n=1 Tax=Manduca sexta TaxID=7130 RepID=A0A921Z3L6_MANSE|nr:hypothetical protein O3G_MSEX006452 [Manduca sexta]